MRKTAFIGVLRKHMTILNVDRLADSIRHIS
jgi:hypothetical protein